MTNTPLKFTGVGTAGTYEQVAQSQQADRESFYGLRPRHFHVSRRGSLPLIAAASPLLAGREERMAPAEWSGFLAAQLARWYSGEPRLAGAGQPGLIAARGADPEEIAAGAGRVLPQPPPPIAGPPAAMPAAASRGLLAGIRRTLGFKAPPPGALPVGAPPGAAHAPARGQGARPPAAPAPTPPPVPVPAATPTHPPPPAAEGFEAEEEIAPGQFYARKKPRFGPP